VIAVEGEPASAGRDGEVTWADGRPFLEHCWHLLGLSSVNLQVCVGEPVQAAGRDRKELARLMHRCVSELGERTAGAPPGGTGRGEESLRLYP
jgi:hypothetical protein